MKREWTTLKEYEDILFDFYGGKSAKSYDMHYYPEKCHSDEARSEMILVERGKPCERETQIWWGSFGLRK